MSNQELGYIQVNYLCKEYKQTSTKSVDLPRNSEAKNCSKELRKKRDPDLRNRIPQTSFF